MVKGAQQGLTVIMSVYNGESYLREAVESILTQTFQDFHFLIVDNGSTDRTGQILSELAESDSRIDVLCNETTLTYVEGRTRAIAEAKTEWVAIMDADDISEPIRLERQLAVINKYGDKLGAVGSWARYINAQGKVLGQCIMGPLTLDEFEDAYRRNEAIVLVDSSAIIHRPTFLQVGGYRPECTPAADLDLWYRIAEAGRALLVVPEFLLRYRVHSGSDSVRKTLLQRKKTHFINYNMRCRRSGKSELTWARYLEQVWSSPWYRYPRLRNDLAMTLYKRAGLYYGARKYGACALNLLCASLLRPGLVVSRLRSQRPLLTARAG